MPLKLSSVAWIMLCGDCLMFELEREAETMEQCKRRGDCLIVLMFLIFVLIMLGPLALVLFFADRQIARMDKEGKVETIQCVVKEIKPYQEKYKDKRLDFDSGEWVEKEKTRDMMALVLDNGQELKFLQNNKIIIPVNKSVVLTFNGKRLISVLELELELERKEE